MIFAYLNLYNLKIKQNNLFIFSKRLCLHKAPHCSLDLVLRLNFLNQKRLSTRPLIFQSDKDTRTDVSTFRSIIQYLYKFKCQFENQL